MGASDGKEAVGPRLAVYFAVWRAFCVLAVVFGAVAAALTVPAVILVLALFIAAVVGTMAASFYGSAAGAGPSWTRRKVVTTAAAGSAAITVILGLTVALGASVLWMTVLLAAGSPPAVRWYGQNLSIGTGVRDIPQRSTADLCRQWRDSYEALHRAKTDRQRLRIVLERQHCLDELGRRDPEGLEAWLTSAASAAGDPSRFLKPTNHKLSD